ncbi:type II toxin-antitoxin system HicB family antitoxin [bacterium]|nr:type II toxin-antitoxin system HicB family antitoxin [bacterium]
MKRKKDVARSFEYEINIVPNEFGGWYARIPDFPTIFTGGVTAAEAMENAQEAIGLMIEELIEREMPVPEPKHHFSGQFNVRIPKELHRDLVRQADNEGVSLNALVSYLLGRSVATQNGTGYHVSARGHKKSRAGS